MASRSGTTPETWHPNVTNSKAVARAAEGRAEGTSSVEVMSSQFASAMAIEEDKIVLRVEVCMKASSTARIDEVQAAVARFFEGRNVYYRDGPLDLADFGDPFLEQNVCSIAVCDTEPEQYKQYGPLLFFQYTPQIYIYQLQEEGPVDDDEGDDGVAAFKELMLPALELAGGWEALHFDSAIKRRLLRYAESALLFAQHNVNPQMVSWNRVVLLHGPPGTGKTSLCRGLAQKLAIRMSNRYRQGTLVEVNAHSLFSKYFSESGKLVSRLFNSITEMVEDGETLVFVMVDEVESLTAQRKINGNEPADAVRAVNALLTQLDALRRFPNVLVLATSNLTGAIDVAFLDRADIKAYIGPPSLQARYEILRTSLAELARSGILAGEAEQQLLPYGDIAAFEAEAAMGLAGHSGNNEHAIAVVLSRELVHAAQACEGLSGRSLRRLPFLAHAGSSIRLQPPVGSCAFLMALRQAAAQEQEERCEVLRGHVGPTKNALVE